MFRFKVIFFCAAVMFPQWQLAAQGYIENRGQVTDQNRQPNANVKYVFEKDNLHLQLHSDSYAWETYREEPAAAGTPATPLQRNYERKQHFSYHRVEVRFVNANRNPLIKAENAIMAPLHFYTNGTGESGAHVYPVQKVTYQDLYPGIDLCFEVNASGRPKYTFVVHKGADFRQIQWEYTGAVNIINKDGSLLLQTSNGQIEESIPLSYAGTPQNPVKITYQNVLPNRYSFKGDFSSETTDLYIDPVAFATYYGGMADDGFSRASADVNGNYLVCGSANSLLNIATTGAFQGSIGGLRDGIIVKFSSAGVRQWATYYGGTNDDYIYHIATDTGANVYIAGDSRSGTGLATTGTWQDSAAGQQNTILAKFNSNGIRIWSTYYGGDGFDYLAAFHLSANGEILVGGMTTSVSGIASTGAYRSVSTNSDAFLAKFSNAGARIWGSYYGGNNIDYITSIDKDSAGNIYLAGYTASSSGVTYGTPYQNTYGGGACDAWLLSLNAGGTPSWATFLGGADNDHGFDVKVVNNSYLIFHGITYSSGGIASSSTVFQPNYSGGIPIGYSNFDGFLSRFTLAGTMVWSTYYGGKEDEICTGTAIESNGNILVYGTTFSDSSIASTGAPKTFCSCAPASRQGDGYILRFSQSGAFIWGSYYGGTSDDGFQHIQVLTGGWLLCAAYTNSSNGYVVSGSHQSTPGGGYDGMLMVLQGNGTLPVHFGKIEAWLQQNNPPVVNGLFTTLSEQNTRMFEVQKSVDGNSFFTLQQIDAMGQSNRLRVYCFTDEQPARAINYYRIQETDRDGKVSMSPVVSLNILKNSTTASFYEIAGEPMFSVLAESPAHWNFEIYRLDGSLLCHWSQNLDEGENVIPLRFPAPDGLYLLRAEAPGQHLVLRIVLK